MKRCKTSSSWRFFYLMKLKLQKDCFFFNFGKWWHRMKTGNWSECSKSWVTKIVINHNCPTPGRSKDPSHYNNVMFWKFSPQIHVQGLWEAHNLRGGLGTIRICHFLIDHFWVTLCLCLKTSPQAKPFMILIYNEPVGERHFHMNGCAQRLVLMLRQKATRKWPIVCYSSCRVRQRGGKREVNNFSKKTDLIFLSTVILWPSTMLPPVTENFWHSCFVIAHWFT